MNKMLSLALLAIITACSTLPADKESQRLACLNEAEKLEKPRHITNTKLMHQLQHKQDPKVLEAKKRCYALHE